MTKHYLYLLLLGLICGCASIGLQELFSGVEEAPTSSYGYSIDDPIKLGYYGLNESISASKTYISRLRLQGEPLVVIYRASTQNPADKNKPLDLYRLVTESAEDTIALYVDVYHKAPVWAPRGLTFVGASME